MTSTGPQLGQGDALLSSGRAAEALQRFDTVLARRPDVAIAHDGRARALRQLGRVDEAEQAAATYATLEAHRSDARIGSLE